MVNVNLPSIPDLPPNIDPGLVSYLRALKENLDILTGRSGNNSRLIDFMEWNREPHFVDNSEFLNGWHNYSGEYFQAHYWKDPNGVVFVRGLVAGGTMGTYDPISGTYDSTSYIFRLKEGFRPIYGTGLFPAVSTISTTALSYGGRVDVNNEGYLRAIFGSNGWIGLDAICFYAGI